MDLCGLINARAQAAASLAEITDDDALGHLGIDECDCVELFAEDAVDRLAVVVERVLRRYEVEILDGPLYSSPRCLNLTRGGGEASPAGPL
jgi:hypothetical protein